MRVRAEVAARAQHRNAVLPHGRQVRAARQQVDLRAAAVQRRADVRADRPGTDDRDLHSPTPPALPTSAARLRRWILPVGPFGISGRIVTRAGRLNAARRSAQ